MIGTSMGIGASSPMPQHPGFPSAVARGPSAMPQQRRGPPKEAPRPPSIMPIRTPETAKPAKPMPLPTGPQPKCANGGVAKPRWTHEGKPLWMCPQAIDSPSQSSRPPTRVGTPSPNEVPRDATPYKLIHSTPCSGGATYKYYVRKVNCGNAEDVVPFVNLGRVSAPKRWNVVAAPSKYGF